MTERDTAAQDQKLAAQRLSRWLVMRRNTQKFCMTERGIPALELSNSTVQRHFLDQRLRRDTDIHHDNNKRYPCPRAETGCTETFTTVQDAKRHADGMHERKSCPCPSAVEFNCSKTFTNRTHAKVHVEKKHGGKRYPCPRAVDLNCPETFTDRNYAKVHVEKKHEGKRYPCPKAVEFNCSKTFTDPQNGKVHSDSEHDGKRYPCPKAKELGCQITFSRKCNARRHAKITHTNPRHKCDKCGRIFTRSCTLRSHKAIHDDPNTYQCQFPSCAKTFTNRSGFEKHIRAFRVGQRKCTVPACTRAVSGQRMPKEMMEHHMKCHESAGHLKDRTSYPESAAAEGLDAREVEELLTTIGKALEDDSGGSTYNQAEDDENKDTANQYNEYMDDDVHIHGLKLYGIRGAQARANIDEENCFISKGQLEYIQRSYENQRFFQLQEGIVAQNIKFIKRNQTTTLQLRNFKLNCLGPRNLPSSFGHGLSFVQQPCPHNSIITLQTAFLCRNNPVSRVGFQPRCAACTEHRIVVDALTRANVLAKHEEKSHCDTRNCFHRRWWKTKFCPAHIRPALKAWDKTTLFLPKADNIKYLTNSLANRWLLTKSSSSSLMQKFLERGKCGGQRWICLDVEAKMSATEIWRIGIVDYDTDEVLINEYLEHSCSYACPCRNVANKSPDIGPAELVRRFQEKGITPRCNVLVWCKTYFDMTHTRSFLAKAGLQALLPSDHKCLLILHQLSHNLTIPLDLRTLYPTVFPEDQLIYQHHNALADAKMLRKLVKAFEPAWWMGKQGEESRKALRQQIQSQVPMEKYLVSRGPAH